MPGRLNRFAPSVRALAAVALTAIDRTQPPCRLSAQLRPLSPPLVSPCYPERRAYRPPAAAYRPFSAAASSSVVQGSPLSLPFLSPAAQLRRHSVSPIPPNHAPWLRSSTQKSCHRAFRARSHPARSPLRSHTRFPSVARTPRLRRRPEY